MLPCAKKSAIKPTAYILNIKSQPSIKRTSIRQHINQGSNRLIIVYYRVIFRENNFYEPFAALRPRYRKNERLFNLQRICLTLICHAANDVSIHLGVCWFWRTLHLCGGHFFTCHRSTSNPINDLCCVYMIILFCVIDTINTSQPSLII